MSKRKAEAEVEGPRMDRMVKRKIEKLERQLAKSELDKAALQAANQTQESMLHRFFQHVGDLAHPAPLAVKQEVEDSDEPMKPAPAEEKQDGPMLMLDAPAAAEEQDADMPPLESVEKAQMNVEVHAEEPLEAKKEAKVEEVQPAAPAAAPPCSILLSTQPVVRAIFPIPIRFKVKDKCLFSKKVLDQTGQFPVPAWSDTENKEQCWLNVLDVFTVCNRVSDSASFAPSD